MAHTKKVLSRHWESTYVIRKSNIYNILLVSKPSCLKSVENTSFQEFAYISGLQGNTGNLRNKNLERTEEIFINLPWSTQFVYCFTVGNTPWNTLYTPISLELVKLGCLPNFDNNQLVCFLPKLFYIISTTTTNGGLFVCVSVCQCVYSSPLHQSTVPLAYN